MPPSVLDTARGESVLLSVHDVHKHFTLEQGLLRGMFGQRKDVVALDGVSLGIQAGEVLALVGESGSGKSTLGHIIVRLLDVTSGTIRYDGEDITALKRLGAFRRRMQIVFQDSNSSLNPRKTIGQALRDPLRLRGVPRNERVTEAARLLAQVGLPAAHADRYPHQLSGGQRQRVGIARALAMQPEFLVADEPVSSLDVSLQAQILQLLMRLRAELGLTMLLISHDLAVVNHVSTRVAVMYAGRIVETGPPAEVFQTPAHPYTEMLIASIPRGLAGRQTRRETMGEPPDPAHLPRGCHFASRCPKVHAICRDVAPPLISASSTRMAACHLV